MEGTVRVEAALLPVWRELLAETDACLLRLSGEPEDEPVETRH